MTKAIGDGEKNAPNNVNDINKSFQLKFWDRLSVRLFPKDFPFDLLIDWTKSLIISMLIGFFLGMFFEVERAFTFLMLLIVSLIVGIFIALWIQSPKFIKERQEKIAEVREKQKLQAQIEESKRLEYLGTMGTAQAHQLNQPVGVIQAEVSRTLADLRDGLFEEDDLEPTLDNILLQANRLGEITENFRRFARGDRVHREEVFLNALVEQTTGYFIEQFKKQGICLKTQLGSSHPQPVAWANPFLLQEVLINLLTNARDAVQGQKEAKIWVKTWCHDGESGFSVEDNGPGLSPEYRNHLFLPFVSTKPTKTSTGLGLYTSRRLIDDLGGRLSYQDRPDGGTRFVVDLPTSKG